MKKGLISKSEAIAIYMEEVKRDLMKNLDIDIRDDISMASASHTNDDEELCMAREAQSADSNEEIDIDTFSKNSKTKWKDLLATLPANEKERCKARRPHKLNNWGNKSKTLIK